MHIYKCRLILIYSYLRLNLQIFPLGMHIKIYRRNETNAQKNISNVYHYCKIFIVYFKQSQIRKSKKYNFTI